MHALNQVWSMQPATERHCHWRRRTPHAHAKHFLVCPRFPTPVTHITNYPFLKKLGGSSEGAHLSTLRTGLQILTYIHIQRHTHHRRHLRNIHPHRQNRCARRKRRKKQEKKEKKKSQLTNKAFSIMFCFGFCGSSFLTTIKWASTVKNVPDLWFLCTFMIVSVDRILSILYCRSDSPTPSTEWHRDITVCVGGEEQLARYHEEAEVNMHEAQKTHKIWYDLQAF